MGTISRRVCCFFVLITIFFMLVVWGAAHAEPIHATLNNGLRVVIVQNTLAPVVTTEVNYLVGSNQSPIGFPGMAHAQEHMMFRGSPGLSGAQLANLIAAMGGQFDADTQQTVTQYFFTVPAEDLEVALHISSIRMQGVLNDQDLWAEERGAIEQEVAQDLSNPMYVFYSRLLEAMYAGTPYAHDALGTRPSFQKTTGAMLKEFYDRWYAPNNAILVIVGDVDPQQTLKLVREFFEKIPSRPLPPRPEIPLQPLEPATIELETDLPYGLAVVAYRLPGYESTDFAASQVLADVLSSQRADLYALVVEGKALFTDFSAAVLPKAGMGFVLAAFPHQADGSALVSRIKKIVSDYVNMGFPEELVEAAKRLEVADAEFQKNSVSGLASLWSQALAIEGRQSPEDDIEAIKKVTVEDVNRVARRYLVNDTAVVGLLTPRPAGKPVKAKSFRRGRESFAPKQTKHVTLPQWAKKALEAPVLPVSRVNPTVYRLPNGLRLIIQQESISPTVSLYGQVKNNPDLEASKGQEGVDQILEDLFSYGTATRDRLAYQKALDDIAASASAGSSFSLQVLEEHFDRGVELLSDNLLHPALPESAFKVVKQEAISSLAGLLKSPSYLSKRALQKALYPKDDPTLRQATPESIGRLTLGEVKAYYTKTFRPDLTTVVIIGKVTPEKARSTIEKYFGEWKTSGPKPETDLPPVPLSGPSVTWVPDTSRVQDAVILAQSLGLTRSNPDYYVLQLGNHVLSGAFYATRLYRDLRENAGLVYTVGSVLNVRKTRSTFEIFYACDPQNVSKARSMVEKDLLDMQETLITPTELQQAKTLLIRKIPLSESSMDDIAQKLLYLSLEDLPLDESLRAAKQYLQTSAEQVQAAFRAWLRPGDFAQVTLGPKTE
jgi:zinc protease